MKVTAFSANKFLKENSQDLTHFPKAVTAVMPLYDSLFPRTYLISISISLHMGQDWTLRRQGLQVTWPFLPGYIFFNHTKVFFVCIFFSYFSHRHCMIGGREILAHTGHSRLAWAQRWILCRMKWLGFFVNSFSKIFSPALRSSGNTVARLSRSLRAVSSWNITW